MDCIQELQAIETSLDGDLVKLGTLLATVDNPVEQMVLAVPAVLKYRFHHQVEAKHFTELETLWRVATEVRKVLLDQQEATLREEAMEYQAAMHEYELSKAESDKMYYSRKNKGLQLQSVGQLELCLEW